MLIKYEEEKQGLGLTALWVCRSIWIWHGSWITFKMAMIAIVFSLSLGGTFNISHAEYNPVAIPDEVIESMAVKDPENHARRIVSGFMQFDMGRFSKAEKHFAKGSRKNKFTFLGVEAPAWQGAEAQEYRDISALWQHRQVGCIGA